MLKKTIRRLGALAMVLAMAVSVFAVNASAADAGEETPTSPTVYSFAKKYTTTTVTPSEALTYTQESKTAESNSEDADAGLDIGTITKAKGENTKFEFTLPAYKGVGQFIYVLKEAPGDTAGVSYDAAKIKVIVTRTWNKANDGTIDTNVAIMDADAAIDSSEKLTDVTNTFDVGSLTVAKELKGDFYDPKDEFQIKVKFTTPADKAVRNSVTYGNSTITEEQWAYAKAEDDHTYGTYTATITVTGGQSVEFDNLPYGITYEVVETTVGDTGKTSNGYTPEYDNKKTGTISTTATSTTVTNKKDAPTPGGVIMTIAPYALMVVLAGAFAVVFLSRRNRAE